MVKEEDLTLEINLANVINECNKILGISSRAA